MTQLDIDTVESEIIFIQERIENIEKVCKKYDFFQTLIELNKHLKELQLKFRTLSEIKKKEVKPITADEYWNNANICSDHELNNLFFGVNHLEVDNIKEMVKKSFKAGEETQKLKDSKIEMWSRENPKGSFAATVKMAYEEGQKSKDFKINELVERLELYKTGHYDRSNMSYSFIAKELLELINGRK